MTAEPPTGMSAPAPEGDGALQRTDTSTPGRLSLGWLRCISPLTEGLVGSLMVALGSYGVGWLVTVSPLTRVEPIILLRTEPAGVVLCTLLLTVGCWVMLRAWMRLPHHVARREGVLTVRSATRAGLLWSAPQMLALPIFSRDVFAYLNQGRLVLAGENPYSTGVSSLENWFQLGTDIIWAEDPTPYGPLFLWYQAGVMGLAEESPDLALLLFRLSCAAGVILLMICVPKLAALCAAEGRPVAPGKAQWIITANPLLIISFISSAHNDALMIGLAISAVWVAARGRGVLAVLLLTLSIGVKPISLLFLPFIGLLWAVSKHRETPGNTPLWRRVAVCWTATLALSAGVLGGIGVLQGYGFGWLEVLGGTGSGSAPWAPLGLVDGLLTGALTITGTPADWTLDVVRTVGRVLSVAVVLALMLWPLRGEHLRSRVLIRMAWALGAVVLLSPLIQPWYLLWLLPLFGITGIRAGWPFGLVVGATGFFLAFGASDQLFIHQFIHLSLPSTEAVEGGLVSTELILRLLSLVVSMFCALLLLFADRPLHQAASETAGTGGRQADTASTTAGIINAGGPSVGRGGTCG